MIGLLRGRHFITLQKQLLKSKYKIDMRYQIESIAVWALAILSNFLYRWASHK